MEPFENGWNPNCLMLGWRHKPLRQSRFVAFEEMVAMTPKHALPILQPLNGSLDAPAP